jgi:tellurite resistance protein TerC
MTELVSFWIGFNVFVLALLALDLGLFHRRSHVVSLRESLAWTGTWFALAMAFAALVWHERGSAKAFEFVTGYVIELSLSADNVFVFALLFGSMAVPPAYQHKVLFWGILGALVMRATMIALGAALITQFTWVIYVFGGFLIVTGLRMLGKRDTVIDPEKNLAVRVLRRLMPVTRGYRGSRFFVREEGRLWITPLLITVVLVEVSDLIFAVDSIPAIFAVTTDPFIVYTSNVFAILGLRSLYVALAGVIDRFHHLKTGLAVILGFVGVKMLLSHTVYQIDTLYSLAVVVVVLAIAVIASIVRRPAPPAVQAPTGGRPTWPGIKADPVNRAPPHSEVST